MGIIFSSQSCSSTVRKISDWELKMGIEGFFNDEVENTYIGFVLIGTEDTKRVGFDHNDFLSDLLSNELLYWT